ncbi:MAG TPA: hypothetical protein VK542_02875 [Gemmatimonadaceae bacterium]|nr:hypothetical protein [Gemmatimonadaceae bacterium]
MNNRIAQAYGYAVCFITVIVMLIAIKSVVDSAFDLSDPIRAENNGFGRGTPALTSFELYKIQSKRAPVFSSPDGSVMLQRGGGGPATTTTPAKTAADTVSDAELRRRYDAEREGVIGNTRFTATRSLVGNLLLIILAAVLFVIHWRWLKKRTDFVPFPPSATRKTETTDTR